jgi:PKD repeat protein
MKILLLLNDIFSAGIRKPGSVLAVVLAMGLLLGANAAQAADPVANAGGPYDGEVGIPVEFNGLGSTDEDNDIVSYAWQFGDNAFGTGPTPTHTYSTQGLFNVFLTVTDAEGGTGGAPTQVQIVAAGSSNKPPEAVVGGPYLGTVDSPVYFDGSGSSDEDGTIEEYAWDFGDQNDRAPSFEKSPSHIYTEPGTYIVNLTVTDNDGDSSTNVGNTTTATITDAEGNPPPESIGNEPPTADAGDSVTGTAGVAVNFDGSGSSDPDGDPLSYAWDFGDNSQLGGGAVQSHTYADDGVYNVTLTVTDPDKATSSDTIQAVIGQGAQAPFAQANGPYEGEALLPVTFSASGSKDADGTIESYKWDFGDGSPDGSGSEVSHVYTTSDNYTVTLTVRDNDGLTGTDTASAVIAAGGNHPPEANAGGPYTGPVNAVIQFDGSKSSDDDGDVRSWEWDFGDDTPLAAGPKVRHTYSTAGTYTVTLTVTDDDSARDSQQTVAEVTGGGNQPPDAKAGGPYPGTAGDAVTFDGTRSSDQEGPIAAYSWDFGDGNTGSDAVSSHTYAADGNYTVTLTVTDGDSASDAKPVARMPVRSMWPLTSMVQNPVTTTAPSRLTRGISGTAITAPVLQQAIPMPRPVHSP